MHYFDGPLLPKKPPRLEGEFPNHESCSPDSGSGPSNAKLSAVIPHALRLHEVLKAAKAFAGAGGDLGTPEWNRLQAAIQEAYGTPEPETPPRAVRLTPVPDTEEDEEPCPPTPRSYQYERHLRMPQSVVPTYCGTEAGISTTVTSVEATNCETCRKRFEAEKNSYEVDS
jgi:hypothetical protein